MKLTFQLHGSLSDKELGYITTKLTEIINNPNDTTYSNSIFIIGNGGGTITSHKDAIFNIPNDISNNDIFRLGQIVGEVLTSINSRMWIQEY